VRIPLDYYRILGVPIQATDSQLSQAYHDRALQLPRREYSDAAIEARKQLLDEAYSVLSDPEQRAEYDAGFLAATQAAAKGSSPRTHPQRATRTRRARNQRPDTVVRN
jgi:DnaJ-class molecular chaperone